MEAVPTGTGRPHVLAGGRSRRDVGRQARDAGRGAAARVSGCLGASHTPRAMPRVCLHNCIIALSHGKLDQFLYVSQNTEGIELKFEILHERSYKNARIKNMTAQRPSNMDIFF